MRWARLSRLLVFRLLLRLMSLVDEHAHRGGFSPCRVDHELGFY